jgi:predicted RND superfamily exporter protein
MWNWLANFIFKNRIALLIIIAGITVFMGYQASKVKIAYSYSQLLPSDDTAWIDYQKFQQQFGPDGIEMIAGMQADSLFSNINMFNDWYTLDHAIKHTGGIENVMSVASLYKVVKNDSLSELIVDTLLHHKPSTALQLDSIKKAIYALPIFENFIYNRHTGTTLMLITFKDKEVNTVRRIAIVDSVKAQMDAFGARYHVTMHYSGMPYIRTIISRKIMNEMIMFIALAILITSLILFFIFRSFYLVVFPLLVVIVGVIWSAALINLFGYQITVLTGLIPPLIMVIGVPNCILLLNKYHTEYRIHGNKIKAMQRMVGKIGISLFLANVTTAIGFAVFCSTHSAVLVQFGLVSSLGVMCTFLISLFLIPIIFSFLPPPKKKHTKHLDREFTVHILKKIDKLVHTRRKIIYAVVVIDLLISIYGIYRIKALGYVVDDLPQNDPIYADMHYFEKCFGGVLPMEIEIDSRQPKGILGESGKTLYKMERLQRMLRSYPIFSRPLSIVEALKFANQAMHDGDSRYYIMPSQGDMQSISQYLQSAGKKQDLYKAFLDTSKQYTCIDLFMQDIGSVKMKQVVSEIIPRADSIFNYSVATKSWLPEDKRYKLVFTGTCLIFSKGNDYLVKNLIESVLLAVILVSLVMYLLFMSVRMVVIATIPSLIPLVITLGLMGFFNVHLKPSTILIFSIAFGISSDGTMYFLTKYKQDMKKYNLSISEIVSLVIKETGVSMIYTAIILASGFMIFIFSGFGGTRALGLLVSVTLLMAYSSNLIVLPSFLLSLEKRINRKQELKSLIDVKFERRDDDDSGIESPTETEKES